MANTTSKPPSKTEILNTIAEKTQLSRQQVSAVFDALGEVLADSLRSSGAFTLPGLVKISKKTVPARPARMGVPNPFKPGETRDVPAKPASTKISVRALKGLKDLA
jgi:nucleoid DNA-binding protein